MTTTPGWYADPYGRYEQRYFDGAGWTAHVAHGGQQFQDDPAAAPAQDARVAKVQQQVQRAGVAPTGGQGGGTIWTEPVLVVNQKAKIIELTNEYEVYNQQGQQIAMVRQVGQSTARKVLRFVSNVDQFLTINLEVVDAAGQPQILITRPAKFVKSTVIVQTPQGQEVGRIVQRNVFGKIRFGLEVNEQEIGSVNAENWRAWNFSIRDAGDNEVARITKTFAGLAAALFTTADKYVVQMHMQLPDPLRWLVIASALCVDTALKQDDKSNY